MHSSSALAVSYRRSGRMEDHEPVAHDLEGWPVPRHVQADASSLASSSTSPPTFPDTPRAAESLSPPSHPVEKRQGHIPRPRNAFFIFRSHFYREMKARQTDVSQNAISCLAATAWKSMSEEAQRPYRKQAEKEKDLHYVLHPDYRYSPTDKATKRAQKKKTVKEGAISKKPSESKKRSSLSRQALIQSIKLESHAPKPTVTEQQAFPTIVSHDAFTNLPSELLPSFVPFNEIPSLDMSLVEQAPKFEHLDLSLRPPSYDRIDPQFGFRPELSHISLPPLPRTEVPFDVTPFMSWDMTSPALSCTALAGLDTSNHSFDVPRDVGVDAGWHSFQTTLDAYCDPFVLNDMDFFSQCFNYNGVNGAPFSTFDQNSSSTGP
ncbi:hypothetical protein AX17_003174 [Amanita inopinata Kibby_2008]|nr:hypothetical protein AX17_003174 [Amanita inopinata Kibby_2008]